VTINYNTEHRSATFKQTKGQQKHEVLEDLLYSTKMCGEDQMERKA
jgi:hypothetical protein